MDLCVSRADLGWDSQNIDSIVDNNSGDVFRWKITFKSTVSHYTVASQALHGNVQSS